MGCLRRMVRLQLCGFRGNFLWFVQFTYAGGLLMPSPPPPFQGANKISALLKSIEPFVRICQQFGHQYTRARTHKHATIVARTVWVSSRDILPQKISIRNFYGRIIRCERKREHLHNEFTSNRFLFLSSFDAFAGFEGTIEMACVCVFISGWYLDWQPLQRSQPLCNLDWFAFLSAFGSKIPFKFANVSNTKYHIHRSQI